MNIPRKIVWMALACTVLLSPSCVQLCGQRVTMRYDEAKDRFFLLIHYDGIHDSGSKQNGDGRKQIPEFVMNGDILFWDWPFHVAFDQVRKTANKENSPPSLRAFANTMMRSVRSRVLGRYRDANGRVGAAQLVVISEFKNFLRAANAAISEAILVDASKGKPDREWRLTHGRLVAAARKKGHEWIAVDGHALKGSLPVHAVEWARGKAEMFAAVLQEAEELGEFKESNPRRAEEKKRELRSVVQLLASAPISINESAGEVSWRVGDPKSAATFRLRMRDKYPTNLEDVVAEHVPVRLDEALARHLLNASEESDPDLNALLEWGPPEEKVRALVGVVRTGGEAARDQALERLENWAAAWNREQGVPEAPVSRGDTALDYVADWEGWYRAMLAFPLKE